MKRFNFRFWAKPHRVYCDNGEFVDAEIATELLEALQRLDDYYTRPITQELSETDEWAQFHREVLVPARGVLAKAKGAS